LPEDRPLNRVQIRWPVVALEALIDRSTGRGSVGDFTFRVMKVPSKELSPPHLPVDSRHYRISKKLLITLHSIPIVTSPFDAIANIFTAPCSLDGCRPCCIHCPFCDFVFLYLL
jgi:hypothetical protein